ncbi:hypothetical protein Pedsa_0436 [Pseudopedobacter saltans DSM 12145]|uniref:Uncharacterized protein n=1 Tax=Pseudopedobacter saltans (strain ATCC 51119 / DSM 12145 / JCM 21818 / CCUG 39354 / LMG 10337 / NBRC 100064 / NCIMB 13643) TaxID=762903 RepID=F0S5U7_PSESL|nr:hypothetical protein [Pseudopedobacter saltans]ADY51018.1 hypothetical protein Pedsa_0436 [Pseudopedobacter saltans DSM 12145]
MRDFSEGNATQIKCAVGKTAKDIPLIYGILLIEPTLKMTYYEYYTLSTMPQL